MYVEYSIVYTFKLGPQMVTDEYIKAAKILHDSLKHFGKLDKNEL